MTTLTLYEKSRCSLCDAARDQVEDLLAELEGRVEAVLVRVEIRDDPVLWERLRRDVPVLEVDGERLMHHRIDVDRLRARLLSATPSPRS
jgi:hypothetical protein